MPEETSPPRRRRGAALEGAILDAAWDQLQETGVTGFTFDAVARRARTNKPALYRRWRSRGALLDAAVRRHGEADRLPLPDTGSLREDLLALLRSANARPERFLALLAAQASGLPEAGRTMADLRETYRADRPRRVELVLRAAAERGEIGGGAVPDAVADLPFDLLVGGVLLTGAALPDERLRFLVDEVALPLVQRAAGSS